MKKPSSGGDQSADETAPSYRVLIVGAFPPPEHKVWGGIATSCKTLLNSPFRRRFDLVLVDSTQASNPPPPFLVRLGLSVPRFGNFVWKLFSTRPACVLIFTSSGAGMLEKGLMGRLAQFGGIPLLMFPRGGRVLEQYGHSSLTRAVAKFALASAEKVLCQGEQWQDFVVEKLGRSREDAPLVRNWTATPDVVSLGRRRRAAARGRTTTLLFVGWLDRAKGVLELLSAFAALSSSRNIHLELVGEGDVSATARQFVHQKNLTDQVTFHGWLEREALLKLYAESDIFVLPSWAEGLPNALIEAMAAGLPVVATDVGNIPSAVTDGRTGMLVPSKDAAALEETLAKLVDDPEYRGWLAQKGHEFAVNSFGLTTAVAALSEVIESVVTTT